MSISSTGSAANAIVPQLFDKSYMTELQTKFSLLSTLVSIIGPGVLGLLLVAVSNEVFLWLFVVCNVAVVFFAWRLDDVQMPEKSPHSIWQDLNEGFAELLRNTSLLIQTWTIFFSNFATSLIIGILTFYALDILQFSKGELGFMFTLSACGGILGAKLMTLLRAHLRRGQIYTY